MTTKKCNCKVLILGNDERAFLSAIRSLGRKGIDVYVGGCLENCSALMSRYIKKRLNLPQYLNENNAWKLELIQNFKQENYALVLPCDDPSMIPLQLNKSELIKYAPIYLLDDNVYAVVSNKAKVSQMARELGVSLPQEELTNKNAVDVNGLVERNGFPIVIKPVSSFRINDLTRRREVKKVCNVDELRECLSEFDADESIIVQKNFIGQGIGLGVLAENGKILYSFQYRRIHEPSAGGGSSYRKSEKISSELFGAASALMKRLSYTGVGMCEFKCNFQTMEWVLIEFNARFWGALPLAVCAGADFPYYLYQLLVEGKKDFKQSYKTNIYCRNWASDALWIKRNLVADKFDKTLNVLPNSKVFFEIKNILLFRERSDTFVLDDFSPAFADFSKIMIWLLAYLKAKFRALLLFCGFRKSEIKRLKKLLEKASVVLFVCQGNICRSPFAELAAKTFFPASVRVFSRGYLGRVGREPPQEAVEAGRSLGFDLAVHRSQLLREEDVFAADVVFVFTEKDYFRLLLMKYQGIEKKMFYLGVAGDKIMFVEDPIGQGANVHTMAYSKIWNLVKNLNKLLCFSKK